MLKTTLPRTTDPVQRFGLQLAACGHYTFANSRCATCAATHRRDARWAAVVAELRDEGYRRYTPDPQIAEFDVTEAANRHCAECDQPGLSVHWFKRTICDGGGYGLPGYRTLFRCDGCGESEEI